MAQVKVGLIGGSGLGGLLAGQEGRRHEVQTPFGPPSDAIVEVEWEGVPVFVLSRHGAGHVYPPSVVPYAANIFALKALGVTHIIASGAVGSLREEIRPRDLVIADQVIDRTYKRTGSFFKRAAVHVEMAEPFCPVLRQILLEAGARDKGQGAGEGNNRSAEADPTRAAAFTVHDRGCYVCMEGPAFSTRAESLMHRLWGGDLIGMTAMPEAKLAREAEISYALVALVTDYDCWRGTSSASTPTAAAVAASNPNAAALAAASGVLGEPSKDELLKEIIANLQAATGNAMALIRAAVGMIAERRDRLPESPAQRALELAIWSDKSRIDPEEVQRLSPLWIKYFGEVSSGQ
jgi:5'-methylthioadenosine phosphorylase